MFVRDGMIVLGRARAGDSAGLARPRAADARRPDRLPGGKHAGRRRLPPGAWDMTREAIRSGLETFAADMDHVPGRFNLLDIHGATVIVDYGHNPSSLIAMIEAIEQFPHQRRTAVYTSAGDRRDCDMVRQGELLGEAFDRVILYEDHYVRGRQAGEIMGLLRQGLARRQADAPRRKRSSAPSRRSKKPPCGTARPGELLLVQADEIDETVNFLKHYPRHARRCAARSRCAKPSKAGCPSRCCPSRPEPRWRWWRKASIEWCSTSEAPRCRIGLRREFYVYQLDPTAGGSQGARRQVDCLDP